MHDIKLQLKNSKKTFRKSRLIFWGHTQNMHEKSCLQLKVSFVICNAKREWGASPSVVSSHMMEVAIK